MIIKVNEVYGGPQIINMNTVQRVTERTGGQAKLWFSADDADTLNVHERFETVESMMDLSINGYPGVVSAESVEAMQKAPASMY